MALQTNDGYIIPESVLNIMPPKKQKKYEVAEVIEEPTTTILKKANIVYQNLIKDI